MSIPTLDISTTESIIRLVVSVGLSGLVGLEREYRHKPAGLRTTTLVGLGSTLVMLLSLYAGQLPQANPIQIAANVITGIGFLGAGLMIQGRDQVHGITTAASVWIVAAVGLAVGIGLYIPAVVATVLALVILMLFGQRQVREKINSSID